MKIGKLQLQLKARSRARPNHAPAWLSLVIAPPTPHRTPASCGHVLQGIMADPPNQLEKPSVPLLSNRQSEESFGWSGSLSNFRMEPNSGACCATFAFA